MKIFSNKKSFLLILALVPLLFLLDVNVVHAADLESYAKGAIVYLSSFVGFLVTLGAEITATLIDPAIISAIFTGTRGEALYQIWAFIRDFVNLFFIFVILFSALATVFQIQKYHVFKSNILLMTIIMALLVNFSWTITRAVMDVGNITMYYFLDNFVDSNSKDKARSLVGSTGDKSGIIAILIPEKGTSDYERVSVTDMVLMGLILLLYAFAFLLIAIIFLVRLAAFVLLLVLSPFGFVMAIFPGTREYSDMWWSALIKWTFVGPLMIFMIFLSMQYMDTMREVIPKVHGYGSTSIEIVTKVLVYSAGVAILYMSVIVSEKLGGSAAQSAMNYSKKFGMKTAKLGFRGLKSATGKLVGAPLLMAGRGFDNITRNPIAKTKGLASGLWKRAKDYEPEYSKEWKKKVASSRAEAQQILGEYAAVKKHEKSVVSKKRDEIKNVDIDELIKIAGDSTEDKLTRKAARQEIVAKKGLIDDITTLNRALRSFGDDFDSAKKLIDTVDSDLFVANRNSYNELLNSTGNLDSASRDKLIKRINSRYVEKGDGHVPYEHKVALGLHPVQSLHEVLGSKTIKEAANQTKLIDSISEGNKYVSDFYKELALDADSKNELIKNSSPNARASLKSGGIV